jgi:hypothetical protein
VHTPNSWVADKVNGGIDLISKFAIQGRGVPVEEGWSVNRQAGPNKRDYRCDLQLCDFEHREPQYLGTAHIMIRGRIAPVSVFTETNLDALSAGCRAMSTRHTCLGSLSRKSILWREAEKTREGFDRQELASKFDTHPSQVHPPLWTWEGCTCTCLAWAISTPQDSDDCQTVESRHSKS